MPVGPVGLERQLRRRAVHGGRDAGGRFLEDEDEIDDDDRNEQAKARANADQAVLSSPPYLLLRASFCKSGPST